MPKGGGGGAGLNAPQEFLMMSGHIRLLLPAKRIFCDENEAPRPAPPPPRFARYASSSGPPPPANAGAERASALTTRSASELDPWRGANWKSPLRYPSLATCFFLPSSKRGGRTPTDADPTTALAHGARSTERARLSAFHHGSHLRELFHPKGSASGQASWDAV